MRKIKYLKDIIDWSLCVGCGACAYVCKKDAITLKNFEHLGIRPIINNSLCEGCNECLSICPGYTIDLKRMDNQKQNELIGSYVEIWEGFAQDETMRFRSSSGGILSAIASYCIEKENMELVLHTGMDELKPWQNKTIISTKRQEILIGAGSRYAPSSPCMDLNIIKKADRPCVFIGKPCDVAALSKIRKIDPELNEKLGLVLTFFCAGVPNTTGALDLIKEMEINPEDIDSVYYRGDGWPGNFRVMYNGHKNQKSMTYMDSWHKLQKYRGFRCHLCPDALGELADISSGDAWHRSQNSESNGYSVVVVRSSLGQEIIRKAIKAEYVKLSPSDSKSVIKAQGIVARRKELFGRLLAMRLLFIPATRFSGFLLFKAWSKNSIFKKIKTILGTIKRLINKGLWHRNRLQ